MKNKELQSLPVHLVNLLKVERKSILDKKKGLKSLLTIMFLIFLCPISFRLCLERQILTTTIQSPTRHNSKKSKALWSSFTTLLLSWCLTKTTTICNLVKKLRSYVKTPTKTLSPVLAHALTLSIECWSHNTMLGYRNNFLNFARTKKKIHIKTLCFRGLKRMKKQDLKEIRFWNRFCLWTFQFKKWIKIGILLLLLLMLKMLNLKKRSMFLACLSG